MLMNEILHQSDLARTHSARTHRSDTLHHIYQRIQGQQLRNSEFRLSRNREHPLPAPPASTPSASVANMNSVQESAVSPTRARHRILSALSASHQQRELSTCARAIEFANRVPSIYTYEEPGNGAATSPLFPELQAVNEPPETSEEQRQLAFITATCACNLFGPSMCAHCSRRQQLHGPVQNAAYYRSKLQGRRNEKPELFQRPGVPIEKHLEPNLFYKIWTDRHRGVQRWNDDPLVMNPVEDAGQFHRGAASSAFGNVLMKSLGGGAEKVDKAVPQRSAPSQYYFTNLQHLEGKMIKKKK